MKLHWSTHYQFPWPPQKIEISRTFPDIPIFIHTKAYYPIIEFILLVVQSIYVFDVCSDLAKYFKVEQFSFAGLWAQNNCEELSTIQKCTSWSSIQFFAWDYPADATKSSVVCCLRPMVRALQMLCEGISLRNKCQSVHGFS